MQAWPFIRCLIAADKYILFTVATLATYSDCLGKIMTTTKTGDEVLALIAREQNGMLCTLSTKLGGWPFGSITPYALAPSGDPLILISEIAEHTHNLRADARASLLVQDSRAASDPQAGARATLVGYAMPVPKPLLESFSPVYLERFPNSASYFEAHDFSLFQIKVSRIRYIGGFGNIHWLDASEITDQTGSADPLAPYARGICEHMNEDHMDAVKLYAAAFAGVKAESAKMIHVDSEGFDIAAASDSRHQHIRLPFASPVTTNDEVRAAMISLLKEAREKMSIGL
jgi:putative heme iron utilization protein